MAPSPSRLSSRRSAKEPRGRSFGLSQPALSERLGPGPRLEQLGQLPPSLAAQAVAGPQATVGNQAVLRWLAAAEAAGGAPTPASGIERLQKARLQAKLEVGAADDPLEREAERVAEQVMRMPALAAAVDLAEEDARAPGDRAAGPMPSLVIPELDDEPLIVHRACAACAAERLEHEPVRRKGGHADPVPEDAAPVVDRLLRTSAGQPIDASARAFMEPRFGVDFSGVRVHAGPEAAASAETLGAHAYTVGHHIAFGAGRYAPQTDAGKRLLAHELTHVVQQSRASGIAARQEMIPGFHAAHPASPTQLEPCRIVQRDKIDHRALTWDDFQGKAPKKSAFEAATASGFVPPDLEGLIPTKLAATDTGEACVIAKKKTGDVTGTTFRVDIGLDQEKITVKAYMSQEDSWRKPWTTDPGARAQKCKAAAVDPCKESFAKRLKDIAKDCRRLEKDCKTAFKAGHGGWSVKFGDTEVAAASAQDCTDVVLARCRELMAAALSFDFTMAGVTITAKTRDECGNAFQTACVEQVLEAASQKLLAHEQGHFDITNVRAGQAQDALRALIDGFDREVTLCARGDTPKAQAAGQAKAIKQARTALAKELKALQKAYDAERKKLGGTQKQYDGQTKHGIEEAIQETWQQNIAKGLP